MKYAWIENEVVRDVCPGDPNQHYTAEIAALYITQVPDGTKNGAVLMGGEWVDLVPHNPFIEPPPMPRMWTANDLRSSMSLVERVRWDNDDSAIIKTAKIETLSAQTLETIGPVLQMLVDSGAITQATMDKALA